MDTETLDGDEFVEEIFIDSDDEGDSPTVHTVDFMVDDDDAENFDNDTESQSIMEICNYDTFYFYPFTLGEGQHPQGLATDNMEFAKLMICLLATHKYDVIIDYKNDYEFEKLGEKMMECLKMQLTSSEYTGEGSVADRMETFGVLLMENDWDELIGDYIDSGESRLFCGSMPRDHEWETMNLIELCRIVFSRMYWRLVETVEDGNYPRGLHEAMDSIFFLEVSQEEEEEHGGARPVVFHDLENNTCAITTSCEPIIDLFHFGGIVMDEYQLFVEATRGDDLMYKIVTFIADDMFPFFSGYHQQVLTPQQELEICETLAEEAFPEFVDEMFEEAEYLEYSIDIAIRVRYLLKQIDVLEVLKIIVASASKQIQAMVRDHLIMKTAKNRERRGKKLQKSIQQQYEEKQRYKQNAGSEYIHDEAYTISNLAAQMNKSFTLAVQDENADDKTEALEGEDIFAAGTEDCTPSMALDVHNSLDFRIMNIDKSFELQRVGLSATDYRSNLQISHCENPEDVAENGDTGSLFTISQSSSVLYMYVDTDHECECEVSIFDSIRGSVLNTTTFTVYNTLCDDGYYGLTAIPKMSDESWPEIPYQTLLGAENNREYQIEDHYSSDGGVVFQTSQNGLLVVVTDHARIEGATNNLACIYTSDWMHVFQGIAWCTDLYGKKRRRSDDPGIVNARVTHCTSQTKPVVTLDILASDGVFYTVDLAFSPGHFLEATPDRSPRAKYVGSDVDFHGEKGLRVRTETRKLRNVTKKHKPVEHYMDGGTPRKVECFTDRNMLIAGGVFCCFPTDICYPKVWYLEPYVCPCDAGGNLFLARGRRRMQEPMLMHGLRSVRVVTIEEHNFAVDYLLLVTPIAASLWEIKEVDTTDDPEGLALELSLQVLPLRGYEMMDALYAGGRLLTAQVATDRKIVPPTGAEDMRDDFMKGKQSVLLAEIFNVSLSESQESYAMSESSSGRTSILSQFSSVEGLFDKIEIE